MYVRGSPGLVRASPSPSALVEGSSVLVCASPLPSVQVRRLPCLVVLFATTTHAAPPPTGGRTQQKLAISDHLKSLNKPPLKSIQSPDGDIIDCVHIAHQPAFDHPSLKNHTIQVRPNFHPERDNSKLSFYDSLNSEKKKKKPTQLWHLNGRCPEGTIPIRRTKEEDVLRASSIERFGKKTHRSIRKTRSAERPEPNSITQSGHQHAIVYVEGGQYYGAKGAINVWEPKIEQPNEFSLSQIWVLGGAFNQDLNSIEAGWQVSPELYGDNRSRLFTYWTSDSYQATGCYNLLCSGFIQISSDIALGASIFPVSSYHGNQYEITLLIWKDPKEGNWWLQFGNDFVLGYWPAFLFSYLTDSASLIEWGGEVVNSESEGQHTTTQMGSGHFPREGYGNSAYFKNIQIVDGTNSLKAPDRIDTFTEESSCYAVQKGSNGNWGNYFFYGGPGRNPNCQ